MKKIVKLFSGLSVMSLALASCSLNNKEDVYVPKLDTEKEVVLNVEGGWDNFEALDEVEKMFNKYYPNVSISYNKYTNINTVLSNACAEGTVDLIFNTKTGASWLEGETGTLYKEYMLNLNETDLPMSNILPDALACGQSDGAQYGIHIYQDLSGITVNVDLLKQHNFSIPKSLSEFETICDTFAAMDSKNHPILAYGKESGRVMATLVYANVIKSSNRTEVVQNLNNGILDESIVSDCVTKYQSWVQKGYFNEVNSTVKDNYNALILEFFNGNVPFMVGTAGTYSGCAKRETADGSTYSDHPFEYAFISMPTGDNENITLSVPSSMFSVVKASPNKDYAVEFLRFAIRQDSMKTFADVKHMPTTTALTLTDSTFSEFSSYKKSDFYTVTGIGLGQTPYSKLRESLDQLKNTDCTATTIKDKFYSKMESYLA